MAGNGRAAGPALIPTGRKALRIGISDDGRFADVTVPGDITEEEILSLIASLAASVMPAIRAPSSGILVPVTGREEGIRIE